MTSSPSEMAKVDFESILSVSSSNSMYNSVVTNDEQFPMQFEAYFMRYVGHKAWKYLVHVVGTLKPGYELKSGEFSITLDQKLPIACQEWNLESLKRHHDDNSEESDFLDYSFFCDGDQEKIQIKARNCMWIGMTFHKFLKGLILIKSLLVILVIFEMEHQTPVWNMDGNVSAIRTNTKASLMNVHGQPTRLDKFVAIADRKGEKGDETKNATSFYFSTGMIDIDHH
jgi:hypothetical protein